MVVEEASPTGSADSLQTRKAVREETAEGTVPAKPSKPSYQLTTVKVWNHQGSVEEAEQAA